MLSDNFSAELAIRDKHQEASIFGDTEADLQTISLTPRINFQSDSHTLIAGIDAYVSTLDTSAIFGGMFPAENASETKRTSMAAYVTGNIALGKTTALNLGLRRQNVELDLENTNLLTSAVTKEDDKGMDDRGM